MAPPSATETETYTNTGTNGATKMDTKSNEPGVSKDTAEALNLKFPKPPKFDDPHKEREYLKGRLAAAFRIFGKYGFDEGVAGHITVRVSSLHLHHPIRYPSRNSTV